MVHGSPWLEKLERKEVGAVDSLVGFSFKLLLTAARVEFEVTRGFMEHPETWAVQSWVNQRRSGKRTGGTDPRKLGLGASCALPVSVGTGELPEPDWLLGGCQATAR